MNQSAIIMAKVFYKEGQWHDKGVIKSLTYGQSDVDSFMTTLLEKEPTGIPGVVTIGEPVLDPLGPIKAVDRIRNWWKTGEVRTIRTILEASTANLGGEVEKLSTTIGRNWDLSPKYSVVQADGICNDILARMCLFGHIFPTDLRRSGSDRTSARRWIRWWHSIQLWAASTWMDR